jgi:hypothetical protein
VAEQQLHDAQVRAVVQQVRRERVPQRVRRQVRAHVRALRVTLDDVPELLARHPVAARGHEQRVGRARAEQRRPRVAR